MDDEEYFFEYFRKRPISLAIAITFALLVVVLGTVGNLVIVVVMLSKRSIQSGAEYLIVNVQVMFVVIAQLLILFIIEEAADHFLTSEICHAKFFLIEFASAVILCSLIGLVVVARFFPKISKKSALLVILLIWTAAAIDAYPYYSQTVYEVTLDSEKNIRRKICGYHEKYMETYSDLLQHKVIMNILEFGLPSAAFIVLSYISLKSGASNQNRSILLYSLAIGCYWIVILAPIRFMIIANFFELPFSYPAFIVLNMLANCITILNPVAYCYFDRVLYKHFRQFLRLSENEDNSSVIDKRGNYEIE